MVVVKLSEKVEGSGYNIDSTLCGELYKEEDESLLPWSGTDPDAKMNCFIFSKEDNDWIFPGDPYNEEFKNQRVPIHNDKFCSQTLEEKIKKENTCSKYASSVKFNEIPRKRKPEISIK